MTVSSVQLRAAVALLAALVCASSIYADEHVFTLRSAVVGGEVPLTIELFRWSTDMERAPVLAALAPPAPAPAAAPAAGGRGGRGGRGARAGGPPASPAVRLTAALKAAPTVGFIWGDGPTGHSIKYAWRSDATGGLQRIVLATDRRLGAHSPSWPAPSRTVDEEEFTVIEIRLDGKGTGEGKASLNANVAIDPTTKTLALDGYETAPILLKVKR